MSRKIRVAIIQPSGNVHFMKVRDGHRFTDDKNNRYEPPTRGDFGKVSLFGIDVEIALYQSGIPKARPAWILPSPGLTGQDLQNVDGDWLLNLVRRALEENAKLQAKEWLILIACGISVLASIASAFMTWQLQKAISALGG